MKNKKLAIEVHNVYKDFYLPHHRNNSVKNIFTQALKPRKKGGNRFHALNGITFNVEQGDFFGVLGRNGSGKSTLLKIISDIYQPTSGHVKHRGKLVSFIELGVGFKADLTGRENVFLNGALLGFSKKEVEDMYDEIVSFAELEDFMDQRLKNYSSGMKVRLAFSVAIRSKADILILDEVLAVGDAAFKKKCNDYFKTLKDDKKTVILVTHGMKAVREFCNKAILIENGKIAFEGTGEAAADEYLRLFNQEEAVARQDKQTGKRSGNKQVSINDFNVVLGVDEIRISALLTANKDPVNDVMYGFRIKSEKGRILIGTSNRNITSGKTLNFAAYETKRVEFVIPNILGNKIYTVSATVKSANNETIYDRWEDIMSIDSKRDTTGGYPLVAPAKLVVKDNHQINL